MVSRWREQIGGVVLATIGLTLTMLVWANTLGFGPFFIRIGVIGPMILVLGLAQTIIPGSERELLPSGKDVSHLQGVKRITRRWWLVIALGTLASVINIGVLLFYWL